jgi:glycosyltransferase involved in cell wall biosynthesis
MLLSLFKRILPCSRIKIISIDLILSKPETMRDHLVSMIKKLILRKVDHFILYMKDSSGYQKYYGIAPGKIKYIPFKINTYNYVINKITENHEYLFAGGVSKRDYDTLFAAVRGLNYPVMVLIPPNVLSMEHGTKIVLKDIPENIRIIHDDGSPESWVDYMAKAKLVVLPIKKNTISPTGVSTYISAMALKKCVVISEGPATRNLIPEGAAVIVPPEDAGALRQAIMKACEDNEFRERTASNGYDYALSLKNHERLVNDIIDFIGEVVAKDGKWTLPLTSAGNG